MSKLFYVGFAIIVNSIFSFGYSNQNIESITPNQFEGSDTQRIQSAVNEAASTTGKVIIPAYNTNGSGVWLLDSAILLPSNITVILDNCTIQLSDISRDNMFRSDNVGIGITDPNWNENIKIIGTGSVLLKGAKNPRATGDSFRVLTQDAEKSRAEGVYRISYGSDAGVKNTKQKGDWRNIMILMAYVNGFELNNVKIENSHSWGVSFERVSNAIIENIQIYNPEVINIGNREVIVFNKDGVNLRHGCKYFKISNVSGVNGDDLIALSSLDVEPYYHSNGNINSYQVTTTQWRGPMDDTEYIIISNCSTNYTGVAIRASDEASIHHVYVNGVITAERPDIPAPYGGSPYTLLVGGIGYGKKSEFKKIHNIFATNLIGDGKNLILIQTPIHNSAFTNGLYSGKADSAITFDTNEDECTNIVYSNLNKLK
ncbi:MAG: glycosyl hydrolase family 28 protein [Dysgonamonadaceae bacterium]|nr:glycosyl hydrolase family 28 protein [Dysgonamonadaceae bacterium]MDD4727429.1 glycosyl hydrolase family 28 protein [Dysgonamonadaceae bacterium]